MIDGKQKSARPNCDESDRFWGYKHRTPYGVKKRILHQKFFA
jgi:hypothetical protein